MLKGAILPQAQWVLCASGHSGLGGGRGRAAAPGHNVLTQHTREAGRRYKVNYLKTLSGKLSSIFMWQNTEK